MVFTQPKVYDVMRRDGTFRRLEQFHRALNGDGIFLNHQGHARRKFAIQERIPGIFHQRKQLLQKLYTKLRSQHVPVQFGR